MYQDMIDYVRNFIETTNANALKPASKFPFRSRFQHIMRVYTWALRINEVEKGDTEIIKIAAIFHDVGKGIKNDKPHAAIGAEICDAYLKRMSYPLEKRLRVVQAIQYHSSKGRDDLPLALEDKILMDADMLDEVGALAVLWDSMATAIGESPSYVKSYERHLKFYKYLNDHKRLLKTDTGTKLYQERLDFLGLFIENLKYELGI